MKIEIKKYINKKNLVEPVIKQFLSTLETKFKDYIDNLIKDEIKKLKEINQEILD